MVLRHKALSLLVTTYILFSKNTLSSTPPAPFTAEQEARIGQIAGDYLLLTRKYWLRTARNFSSNRMSVSSCTSG